MNRMGVITPEGEFVPLAFRAHQDYHYKFNGGYPSLTRLGFIIIGAGGFDMDLNHKPTVKQRETAKALVDGYDTATVEDWDIELNQNPEGYDLDLSDDHNPTYQAVEDGKTWPAYVRSTFELWFEDRPGIAVHLNTPPLQLSRRVGDGD